MNRRNKIKLGTGISVLLMTIFIFNVIRVAAHGPPGIDSNTQLNNGSIDSIYLDHMAGGYTGCH